MTTLKTAEHAVLKAVRQRDGGHGNVHQLAEESGYARSTVDKAIKALAGAGLITEYDTGADPAERTPTQWQLTDKGEMALTDAENGDSTDDAELAPDENADPAGSDSEQEDGDGNGDDQIPGQDEDDVTDNEDDDGTDDEDEDGEDDDDDSDEDSDDGEDDHGGVSGTESGQPPANQRVLCLAGAMVAHPDGRSLEQLHAITNYPESALNRLLAAMVAGGAAVFMPAGDDGPARWSNGLADPALINPHPAAARCPGCERKLPDGFDLEAAAAAARQEAKTPPPSVFTLAGAMYPHTDGATAAQLAKASRLAPELVDRALVAMEKAGAVASSAEPGPDGETLWTLQVGQSLDAVDLDPKCDGCFRPMPGSRSSGNTPTGIRREDALARNELKNAQWQFIIARPGIPLTPGMMAKGLAAELARDKVSPGALKNNCDVWVAEGKIVQVTVKPYVIIFPPQTASDATSGQDPQPAGEPASTVPGANDTSEDGGGEQDNIA